MNPIEWFVPLIWNVNNTTYPYDSYPTILIKLAFNYAQFFGMVILLFAAIHFGWNLVN